MRNRQDAFLTLRRSRRHPPCFGQQRMVKTTQIDIQGRQIKLQIVA
jgi:hypothetical protein